VEITSNRPNRRLLCIFDSGTVLLILHVTVKHVQPNVAISVQCRAIVMIYCLSSVTQVYWDKTAEVRITLFPLTLSAKSDVGFLDRGLNLGWGGFWLCDSISRKRCEIELTWQLITNRKSYYGLSTATKVLDLEWPWTSIHWFVVRVVRVVTNWLRLESLGFRYKVALYLSYLRIKLDGEIQQESFRISNIIWLVSD